MLRTIAKIDVQAITSCLPSTLSSKSFASDSANTNDQQLVQVEVNDKTGFATVTLNSPPVNTLNLPLLTAFSETLDLLQNDRSRGMILTSSSNSVFSAGLDIMEMYKPTNDRLKAFWGTLQDCWLKLYGSSFPTAAAINGHAPAGKTI